MLLIFQTGAGGREWRVECAGGVCPGGDEEETDDDEDEDGDKEGQ